VCWEDDHSDYYLEIGSDSIEVLKLQYHKNYHLVAIEARNLKNLQIDSCFQFCLYHSQSSQDGLWLVNDL
jgi:hypothetical protein